MATAWPVVARAIAQAPYPVEVQPVDGARAAACLARLGVTVRSWLGAVIAESGGLLIDHGWLRVLGGGSADLPDVATANGLPAASITRFGVGFDVLGGQFALTARGIEYLGPGALAWEWLGVDYAAWLAGMLSGGTDELYAALRWDGWQAEVAAVSVDHGLLAGRTVPVGELFEYYTAAAAARRHVGEP